jgi:hypothetical protein
MKLSRAASASIDLRQGNFGNTVRMPEEEVGWPATNSPLTAGSSVKGARQDMFQIRIHDRDAPTGPCMYPVN